MSEIRAASQQLDRETLSQDIEKLKLAVKDTSLNRTWEDYSDSDDDALHITEDQNSRDVNDDGQLGERVVGTVERFFPEETIQGISQDSLGSLGSVELANSPEVCLALNREYQDWIRKNLNRIQIVLEHNRQCQREVRLEMQEKSSEKMALNSKRKTLTVYAKPYFKTVDGSFPPPNDDTMIKRNSRELDPFIRPPKSWSSSERNKLRAAVQGDRLQKSLRPFMNRKECEVDRLRLVTPDSEEEAQIKEKIEEFDNKMKAIRVSIDINVIYGNLSDLESIDWMKIANVDFEGQRSAEACKLFWLNAAHPSINVMKWTSAEDMRLVEFVSSFEGVHWVEIAQGLGTNRSAFMCLQRYQTKLNPCLQTGKWTSEEDEFLKEVISNYKSGDSIPWSTVAYYVEGRSREQCARRWEQLHPKSFKKGKWTMEEDRKLLEAAKLFGVNKWWKIREFVPGRTAAQCRERWKNTLDYNIHFGEWKYEEDRTLWLTVQELGAGHWQSIAKDYLPGRTDNMCLQRYRRLVHWYQENKAQERVKRQSKAGGWRQSNRWRKLADKQYLKRKQLEKVLDRAKTDQKEKEILSALKYVEGICVDGQGQGDDGHLERSTEQISDVENQAVAESGDHVFSATEIEAVERDKDLGIVIPRPPTRSCVNRNCLPELHKYRLRSDIGRRVASQVLSERRAPSNLRSRLEELISGKGTTGFSQPLQEKLQSLSDNSTIRQIIDLSTEIKQEVTSTLGSSSSCLPRGRPKRSEEEDAVEQKISMLVCNPVVGARGFNQYIRFLGVDSSRTALKSAKKNSEDKQGRVVRLMANALGFRKCPSGVHSSREQSSCSSPASGASLQTSPVQPSSSARHGLTKQAAKAIPPLSPESSVIVVLKRASSSSSHSPSPANHSLQHTPSNERVTPEFTSCATSDPRLDPSMLKQSAYGRAALYGAQAKIYQMPPLPPSGCTLNAFKTLLLNRTKLLSVAGKFHIPGILPVPKSMRQQETLKTDDKVLDSATGGMETKASESLVQEEDEKEKEDGKEIGTGENSLKAETECSDVKSAVGDDIRRSDGRSSKGFPSVSKRGRGGKWAAGRKAPRRLSQIVDKGSKQQLQLQVVKSKLRSRRVLAAVHASHDYQLLRSRFLSLFLWPAFMSTLPVEEVKRCSSLRVSRGTEGDDASLSAEELEQDNNVDECSSDDDDWSKRHYKKRYAGSGKPKVYSRWKRKEERDVAEETDGMQDASSSVDMGLVSSVGRRGNSSHHADNSSCGVSRTESRRKKRSHHQSSLLLDDCRKSRRLAEKRDLKQRTEDQESVLAVEHHRAMLKATDTEYDSENSAPRKKRGRMMADQSDSEQKPLLQPAFLDANGFIQSFIIGPDGILQPVVMNSGQFVETVVGPDGFLRPSSSVLHSEPPLSNLGDASQFIQPMVLNFDEVSGSTGRSLCLTHMNAAGDAQNVSAKLESFTVAEEGSVASLSVQLSLSGDHCSVPVDCTVAQSSGAEKSDRCSMEGTVQHNGSSEDQMDCSDFTSVAETLTNNCLDSLKSEVDAASGTLDQSCEKNSTMRSNYNENELDKEATDQKRVQVSNLDVLIRASELMEKNVTDAGLQTGYEAPRAPAIEISIPSSVLHSYLHPDDADQMQLERCTSDENDCIVIVTGMTHTDDSTINTEQKTDVNPTSLHDKQLERTVSPTQYSVISGDTNCCSQDSVSTETHINSVTSGSIMSCFTPYDCLVARAVEANHTVTSSALVNCRSGHVDGDIKIDLVSAEEKIRQQSAGDEGSCSQPAEGQLKLSPASRVRSDAGSVIGDVGMDWTATLTTATVSSSDSSPQSSVSSVRILSTAQSDNYSNADREMKDNSIEDLEVKLTSSESESPIVLDASDQLSAKTSVFNSQEDSKSLANSQQSTDLQTQVPFANCAFSFPSTFSMSPASPQAMMSNVLPVLSTMPSFLQNATAAAVQQLTTVIMSQLLESIQMQMQQSQMQGAQSMTSPLANAMMQSAAGLPSAAGLQTITGLQQPAVLQSLSGLQLPAALHQPHMLQQSASAQQLADLQSSARLQSPVAFQLPGFQPSVGLLGAGFPLDWLSSSGLQAGSALQADGSFQPAIGLQNGAMMQTTLGNWQNSCTGAMGSNSGMQGSVDSQFDNKISGGILSAESSLQASPSQSTFSMVSKSPSSSQTFMQITTGNLSGSPRFSGNLPGSQPFMHTLPGNLPGSHSYLYPVAGNLVTSQPLFHTLSGNMSGLYPLLHNAPANLLGSQPYLQTMPENLSSSQSLLHTVPAPSVPGSSQPCLEPLPQNPSSASTVQTIVLHSQQLHDLSFVNACQSSAASTNATASFSQQPVGCLVPQLSGQFQQPVSAANSSHQMTSQGLGPFYDASVRQQFQPEPISTYARPMHPTNQALIYRSPTVPGYLPSFMGMQAMNSCPTVLPVASSSSSAPTPSSSTADQQLMPAPAAAAVNRAPESSK